MTHRIIVAFSAISLAFLALGCSSSSESGNDDATETGGGGQDLGTGGGTTTSAGGAATGGLGSASTIGGATGTGESTGGLTGTTGGATGTTGGSSGGTPATGGNSGGSTGGGPASGGAENTGGITSAGTGGIDNLTGGSGGTTAETGGTTAETGGTTGETGGTTAETGGGGTVNPNCDTTLPVLDNLAAAQDFTETAAGLSLDMVYIPGGTFTLGCESGGCDPDTSPVEGVTVSSYHVSKTEVTAAMMEAVMGEAPGGFGTGTWYDCIRFACELSRQSGRAYRMMTEAEFEYAAKNHLSQLDQIDGSEEWAYNSWSVTHSTVLNDPVGASPGAHTQKTRRDKATGDNITGRLIRSIDGIGPACRMVVSNEMDYPPEYVPPCKTCQPILSGEPENSYRDPRWITGDDAHWGTGSIAIGSFDLQVWEDGTATMGGTDGQWFTSNNIAFVFVPNSGSISTYAYIFLDENQGTVISDKGFMNGGFVGRYEKAAGGDTKPTIANLRSGAELAADAGDDYDMVDMENIPETAKEQDPRLLDGAGNCWFQNNSQVGGTHNYRKDVDADEFRFAVIDGGQRIMLANGSWFTINNTFLRITHPDGYVADYLYAVADGSFLHNSFQGYERADFRMFEIYESNDSGFPATCVNNSCSGELDKGAAQPFYSTMDDGGSTFTPAPCPAGGC